MLEVKNMLHLCTPHTTHGALKHSITVTALVQFKPEETDKAIMGNPVKALKQHNFWSR